MLMTGVVLTSLSGAFHYLMSDILTQLLLDKDDNEQPLERQLK
jgi:hypothetical protein